MHALSLGTWWIHVTTLFEWILAIVLILRWSIQNNKPNMKWLALAMLPNLASAMAAITWHIYDNASSLKGLVVLQSGLTVVGNFCLAAAAWNLVRTKNKQSQPS
ncbi:DUF2499 domain-containing protein [Prochlorococcus sp. MIT 1341]|uniref:DUF2499 domain-containing protein n=1 Tax=Prochlorococcus sp. MIT 1341 TaxID=3096221 RepID=UPI002A74D7C8|nr:DUF2499 domain-containing protein [Prochlorococcus sp. MIT 1341]